MSRSSLNFAASLSLVVLLAACGSDSESSDPTDAVTITVAAGEGSSITAAPETSADTGATEDTGSTTDTGSTDDTGSTNTTGSTVDTGSTTDTDDPACAALQVISEYDSDSSELVATSPDFATLKAFIVGSTPDVLQAYDDAIAADPEIATDATTLRDFTAAAAAAFADAQTEDEASAAIGNIPGATEAGAAGQSLDQYATDRCGFSISNN